MPLIESLLLLLIVARVIGEIAERFGQPAMMGEIISGVILGPSVLHIIQSTREIKAIADIGVLLLVFLVGMDMDLDALWKAFRGRGVWVSVSGFAIPLALGIAAGMAFGLDRTRMIFLGLCIAITALPVSVRILADLGKLDTEVGRKIISAAVANDVASLLLLGIILDAKSSAGAPALALTVLLALVKALVFMAGFILVSRLIKRYAPGPLARSRNLLDPLVAKLKGKESLFAIIFLFVIAFASFSEALGLDFIVGAFFGSMLLSHEIMGRRNFAEIHKTASNVTMGFLGPIFFAAIGLQFQVSSLRDWKLVSVVLLAAFVGKIFGGYAGGRLALLSTEESWALGIGLNGRGVMELAIANAALAHGLIGSQLFTILVLMAVATTLVTPLLLKWAFDRLPQAASGRSLHGASVLGEDHLPPEP